MEEASQCGNFKIFLPFRIYVKSILVNLQLLRLSIWQFLKIFLLDFGSFMQFLGVEKSLRAVPMIIFDPKFWSKLISRKMWVANYFLNFHTWVRKTGSKEFCMFFMQTLWAIELSHESKIIGIFGQTSFQFLCPLAKSLYFLVDSNYS